MDAKKKIRNRVIEILQQRGYDGDIHDGTPLVSAGLLNSIDIVQVAVLMEESWGIDFNDRGFNQNDFENINRMVDLVKRMSHSS